MGTWGARSFENDAALDWLSELEAYGIAAIRNTLEAVTGAIAYVDADEAQFAVAAAEVVAAARGNGGDELPEEVGVWINAHAAKVSGQDAVLARNAATRVRDSSELQELWDDNGPDNDWKHHIGGLIVRLSKDPVGIRT